MMSEWKLVDVEGIGSGYACLTLDGVRYRDVAAQARTEIVRRGGVPREYSGYAKMMSRMGIAMKTANNRSSKNIASLMIRGTTMGIIDMQHAVNCSQGAENRIRSDAQDLLRREQDFCDHLKSYL